MSKPQTLDKRYARSLRGILKVAEFLALLAAFPCLLQFNKLNNVQMFATDPEAIPFRELFFVVVCLTGLAFIILIYLLKFCQLDRLCCEKTSLCNIWDTFITFVMAVLCTLASALMVESIRVYPKKGRLWYYTHLCLAVVFGFLAALMFLTDSVVGIYYQMKKIENKHPPSQKELHTIGNLSSKL